MDITSDLKQAIERLHECTASYNETVGVIEKHEDMTVWEGTVHVFDIDHPETDTCYAWSHPIEGSEKHKYYAVLKIPPVDTPEAAVRAAIVADHKEDRT